VVALVDRPSPNHNERPAGADGEPRPPDMIVLHYTGMRSGAEALERLCDPAAKVSAHFLIEEDGTCYRLVPAHRRAWHAGVACWAGETDVNGRSLGIELVNPGHEFGYRPFPEPQMAALLELLHVLKARHPVPRARVVGHSDVAPLRKEDPGELFDWPRLAAEGLAVATPAPAPAEAKAAPDPSAARAHLAALGYGFLDEDLPAVLRAFQRRFRPAAVTGALDGETAGLLAALARG
jgi:N-acetylmuramoyl-L-alanine amidase